MKRPTKREQPPAHLLFLTGLAVSSSIILSEISQPLLIVSTLWSLLTFVFLVFVLTLSF